MEIQFHTAFVTVICKYIAGFYLKNFTSSCVYCTLHKRKEYLDIFKRSTVMVHGLYNAYTYFSYKKPEYNKQIGLWSSVV